MTTAERLFSRLNAAPTGSAEWERVSDDIFREKVRKEGTPDHGWLWFADGSGLEVVSSDAEDAILVRHLRTAMRTSCAIPKQPRTSPGK